MIAFLVFCGIVMSGGVYNFRHEVKSHDEIVIVNHEDPSLKKRGINLPGYNH